MKTSKAYGLPGAALPAAVLATAAFAQSAASMPPGRGAAVILAAYGADLPERPCRIVAEDGTTFDLEDRSDAKLAPKPPGWTARPSLEACSPALSRAASR